MAAVSLSVLVAAASYAFAPVSEAIATTVTAVTASAHHSAIEGKVLEGKRGARGVRIVVVRRVKVHGKWRNRVVGRATVRANGKFWIHVRPGKYAVIIRDGKRAHRVLHVRVRKNKSVFIAGTVKKHSGGLSIAPVVFNY